MKLFEVPMVATSLVGLCFLTGLDAPPARADFTFGEPADLDLAVRFFPSFDVFVSCLSTDGLEMFVESDLAAEPGSRDIWVLKRVSPESDWGPPENLGPAVNSASMEFCSSISGDGLELYFMSTRPGGYGAADLYVTRRATRTSPWEPATNLGPKVNSSYNDVGTSVSSDRLELYFGSQRPGGYGVVDLYVSKRPTTQDPWGDPENLGPAVNSMIWGECPCLSADGLLLVFQGGRPGGVGDCDLWMARRVSRTAPWEPAVNLGPIINSPEYDCRPCLAPDGSALYFAWNWPDRRAKPWKASIIPIVDFNGDGIVDARDMDLLAADWGKSDSVCDIGPLAWGDGVVDEKDLYVLMESLMTPGPKASDVPCNVVLSWIGPSFADSYDVYFGTSFDDVSNATRDDPCGVLVSEGQTETTCEPDGPLEFSQTYYWRVDGVEVVLGSLDPVIYRGPVLSFTTEAYAYPIPNITATASSSSPGMGPEKTVDGSGLDEDDGHSTNLPDMWQSTNTGPHWIQFEFDKVYVLHELWVWNSNQAIEPIVGFGAKTVKIEYSTDGTAWTALDAVPEFARAPGQPAYTPHTIVAFGGVAAKYVKLTTEASWGGIIPSTGLSEVRFFYIPDRSVIQP